MITRKQTVKKYTVTAGVLEYGVPFPIYEQNDVLVIWSVDHEGRKEHTLSLGPDYSVRLNSAGNGGIVTLVSGRVPVGATLAVISNIPETQELDLYHTAEVDTESLEDELDRQVQMIQQLSDTLARCIKVGVTSGLTPEQLLEAIFHARDQVLAGLIFAGNTTGATMIVADGTTTPRSISDRFANIINVKDFGAKGDGVTDDTESIQAAIDSIRYSKVSKSVYLPCGKYFISKTINIPQKICIYGDGITTEIVADSSIVYAFSSHGEMDDIEYRLNENATSFDTTLSTNIPVSVGDDILLVSQRNALSPDGGKDWQLGVPTSGSHATYYAEVIKVVEKNDNGFSFQPPLVFPDYNKDNSQETDQYARNGSTVAKIYFNTDIEIRDLKIINVGIRFTLVSKSTIKNIVFDKNIYNGYAIHFDRCYGCNIIECDVHHDPNLWLNDLSHHLKPNTKYWTWNSYVIASSWNCCLENCSDWHGMQGYDVSNYDYSYPTMFTTFKNCKSFNNFLNGLTIHPGQFGTSITGCSFINCLTGVLLRSPYTLIDSCYIYTSGNNVFASDSNTGEVNRGIDIQLGFFHHSSIIGNKITRTGVGISFDFYSNTLGGGYRNSSTIVSGNHFDKCEYGIRLNTNTSDTPLGNAEPFNISINGNVFSNINCSVYSTAYPNGICIDGNTFINASGHDYHVILLGDYAKNISINNNIFSEIRSTSSSVIAVGSFYQDITNYSSINNNNFINVEADKYSYSILNNPSVFSISKVVAGDKQNLNRTLSGISSAGMICASTEASPNYGGKICIDTVSKSGIGLRGHLAFMNNDTINAGTIEYSEVEKEDSGTVEYSTEIKHNIGDGKTGIVLRSRSTNENSTFFPRTDNIIDLGYGGNRWKNIYGATGAINTSDERVKSNIETISDDVFRAWERVNFNLFQFTDAVEHKSSGARIHIGVIAQRINDSFAAEGLDAARYGLFCYDEWDDEYEDFEVEDAAAVYDEDGNQIRPAQFHTEKRLVCKAGNRYGIRYTEALCLEAAYQRRKADRLEARIAALEAKLGIV